MPDVRRNTQLFWFRQDLRLDDNAALADHAGAETLLCVFCLPRPRPWCNLSGIGAQRQRFLLESLGDLQQALAAQGQQLLIVDQPPAQAIPELTRQYRVSRVGVSRSPGVYEAREVREVAAQLEVPLQVHTGNTLFQATQLPFAVADCPSQYTPFRQAVKDLAPRTPQSCPDLPPPPPGLAPAQLPAAPCQAHPAFAHRGGMQAGTGRLQMWLDRGLAHYRETRNELEGLLHASHLSPWLANGSLSVRRVAAAIRDYEREHGASEHTDWFYRELLWREFYHWRAYRDGKHLFRPGGVKGRHPLKTFDPRSFARWCAGDTDYPLVNALLHQLVATGWMSNRGRQIAASCLINEMNMDWRYGAAFFEKHLLDHDVASNYGNWQYIAGVGADPRGGRHFNLARQAAQFDPDGEFTARWDGHRPAQPQYVTDAADWPLSPDDEPS